MKKKKSKVDVVEIAGIGGFPVKSLSYWKMIEVSDGTGATNTAIHVQFKSGGFMDIPTSILSEEQFASLVFGQPF